MQYLEAMGIDVWVPRASANHEQSFAVIENADSFSPAGSESTESVIWNSLQAEVASCTKCSLCKTRTQTVFGSGNKHADWMVIGEAPGQSEDQQGLPFVGNAGQLLTEMLRAIGLDRESVFITNVVKCRPPGNRDPKPNEIEACNEYLQRQQALVKPKIILAVGRIAAQALLKTDEPLAKLRGKVHILNDTPVVVVYHPAYLLRSLSDKRKAWLDLQLAMQTYNKIKG
ncbi:MAG: uracil-DNA glycosylase [Methylobacter sp.]|nr:uracil-DNA glycosylase [Methylobacter sp.]